MSSLRVVLAGGGSAGHVNPLLATAGELVAHGASVTAVGTKQGLENDLVPKAGYELETIEKVPFPRRPTLAALRFPREFRKAVTEAGSILDRKQPHVVCGFGGFVSTPIYVAAKKRHIPVVVHEQNAKPGLANRYGARFAAGVGLTFGSTPLDARDGVTELVGLPLRRSIAEVAHERREDPDGTREQAARRLGLDPALPTLVVTGGSLGAQHLNDVVSACIPLYDGIQVFHLTGKGKAAPVLRAAQNCPTYHVREYLDQMEDAYAVADLVVCRSGAGTVAEVSALGVPAFFVPLPIGNGEQELNAADVIAAGGAYLVRNKDFTGQVMAARVIPLLLDSDRLARMGEAARGVSPIDGAQRLARMIMMVGERRI